MLVLSVFVLHHKLGARSEATGVALIVCDTATIASLLSYSIHFVRPDAALAIASELKSMQANEVEAQLAGGETENGEKDAAAAASKTQREQRGRIAQLIHTFFLAHAWFYLLDTAW